MTDFERIGEERLARAVGDFVDRFFGDFVIGFLFEGKDRDRIARHELEHASRHLGGPMPYTGRGLKPVHQPLRINKGHFRRRLAIVRHTLREHGVDDDVIERWLAFERKLEPTITTDLDCLPGS